MRIVGCGNLSCPSSGSVRVPGRSQYWHRKNPPKFPCRGRLAHVGKSHKGAGNRSGGSFRRATKQREGPHDTLFVPTHLPTFSFLFCATWRQLSPPPLRVPRLRRATPRRCTRKAATGQKTSCISRRLLNSSECAGISLLLVVLYAQTCSGCGNWVDRLHVLPTSIPPPVVTQHGRLRCHRREGQSSEHNTRHTASPRLNL